MWNFNSVSNVLIFSEGPSYGGHFDTKNFKIEAIIIFGGIEFGNQPIQLQPNLIHII
jgi:hypothetical protein